MIRVSVSTESSSGQAVNFDGLYASELLDTFVGAAVAAGWARESVLEAMADLLHAESDGTEEEQ